MQITTGWSVCLPLLVSPCTIKSKSSFLAQAHPGGSGKRAVKRLWCGGSGWSVRETCSESWHLPGVIDTLATLLDDASSFASSSFTRCLPLPSFLDWVMRRGYLSEARCRWSTLYSSVTVRKGKERKSIYIAPFCTKVHSKRSGMDHTVLPANNTMPAFPLWRSPDVTTTATEATDIQLQLTTHLSTPKGWKAELA